MFDQFSDGYCPECLLKNEMRDMILNDSDFWECPVCHLQARSGGGFFVLLRTRGNGRLKTTKATDPGNRAIGLVLIRAKIDNKFEVDVSEDFKSEDDLREFLTKEVH